MHFRNHLLLYTLIPVIIIIGITSYYRYVVSHNYTVAYEGKCDPSTENCFLGCKDDECTEEYYYTLVEKYAADLYEQCGPNITDCDAASICLPGEQACSVTYCDIEVDGESCEMLVEELEETSTEEGAPLEAEGESTEE